MTECQGRAQQWGVPYVETSAKTRENVDKVTINAQAIVLSHFRFVSVAPVLFAYFEKKNEKEELRYTRQKVFRFVCVALETLEIYLL